MKAARPLPSMSAEPVSIRAVPRNSRTGTGAPDTNAPAMFGLTGIRDVTS